MKFYNRVARYILDDKPVGELPGIAIQGMDEGIDSPAIVFLAGLDKSTSPFLYDEQFPMLLEQLGIGFLADKVKSALYLARSVAFGIVQHDIEVYRGCNEIFREILDRVDVTVSGENFVFEGIGLAKVYGDFISLEELTNASEAWDIAKTNEQLAEEARLSIKAGLIQWLIGPQ